MESGALELDFLLPTTFASPTIKFAESVRVLFADNPLALDCPAVSVTVLWTEELNPLAQGVFDARSV